MSGISPEDKENKQGELIRDEEDSSLSKNKLHDLDNIKDPNDDETINDESMLESILKKQKQEAIPSRQYAPI